MKEKVKITKITHFTKNRDGGALVTKDGKPYTRCLVNTEDGRTISGFGSQTTNGWQVGDTVELDITQNGNYFNFKIPRVNLFEIQARIEELEKTIKEQEERIGQIEAML